MWLKLHDGLPYEKAMQRCRKIQREEATLRAKGGFGNYADVAVRLSFDGPGRKEYAVYVEVTTAPAIAAVIRSTK